MHRGRAAEGAPAVILIKPQLGENIGMAARAMLNCGLAEMRLVAPRDGWPNPAAEAAASGATLVLDNAKVFATTEEAIADLNLLYASTARSRDMTKPLVTPRQAAREIHKARASGIRAGVLFGPEAKGLNNDDVSLADAILMVPLNPGFSSLNLAQAVLLIGYEWFQAGLDVPDRELAMPADTRPANKQELAYLFEHLETELDACGFLHVEEKRPIMVRNLRNMFQRAELTEQEVRTLRGVIVGLVQGKKRRGES
ncbi:MAG: RNA methyltransferase [Rhodospirillales bacterium]|nr:RNA methyltransferase [Rhodospirillales bacterium]